MIGYPRQRDGLSSISIFQHDGLGTRLSRRCVGGTKTVVVLALNFELPDDAYGRQFARAPVFPAISRYFCTAGTVVGAGLFTRPQAGANSVKTSRTILCRIILFPPPSDTALMEKRAKKTVRWSPGIVTLKSRLEVGRWHGPLAGNPPRSIAVSTISATRSYPGLAKRRLRTQLSRRSQVG